MNFVKVPNLFIDMEFKELSPIATLAYIGLMYYVNENHGGLAAPRIRDWAELIGVSHPYIIKAKKELLAERRIGVELAREKKEGNRCYYDLLYKPFECTSNFTLVPLEVLGIKRDVLNVSAKVQYIYILRLYGNGNKGPVFAKQETLGNATGVKVDMADENLERLEELGLIQVITRKEKTFERHYSRCYITPLAVVVPKESKEQ